MSDGRMPALSLAALFPEVGERLVAVLRELSEAEWALRTVSSRRTVKDVAAHLLDGSLRRLSAQRDGYAAPGGGPREGESLLAFLTRLNDEWETGVRRLSPRVLVDLVELSDRQLAEFVAGLDPAGEAIFPVAWAGEERSANWMDIAREYTERWHHTQQIFEATGRASTIVERRLFHPCLDTFLRALPYAYREVPAAEGTVVQVTIRGEAGGDWYIVRERGGWRQVAETPGEAAATCAIGQDSAWKLFTKRMDRETARARFGDIELSGDAELAAHVLEMVSVMA